MSDPGLLRVIVPMKPAWEGKLRLTSVLDPEGRAALCLLLLQHVLRAIAQSAATLETWVIGGGDHVQAVASQESARWEVDPGDDLNEAIRHAADRAYEDGAPGVLVLPGDLGLLRPEEVDQLVALSEGLQRVVLARAIMDGGTNAILAPRGLLMGPYFGPNSFRRHLETTQKAGIPVEVADAPGLGFDLDTPEDLLYYRKVKPDLDEALEVWRHKLQSLASVGTDKSRKSNL